MASSLTITWNEKYLRFTLRKDAKFISISEVNFDILQLLLKTKKSLKVICYQGSSSVMLEKVNDSDDYVLTYKNMKIKSLNLTLTDQDIVVIGNYTRNDNIVNEPLDISVVGNIDDLPAVASTSRLSRKRRNSNTQDFLGVMEPKKQIVGKKPRKTETVDLFNLDTQDMLYDSSILTQRML